VPHATEDCAPIEIPASELMATLHSVICSEELPRRGSRLPDYEKENRALTKLAAALATSPTHILQILVETVLEATDCDSAGVSLQTNVDGEERLRWPAIAGMWAESASRQTPHLPRGVLVAGECLRAPFCFQGIEIGGVWAVMHSHRRMFDAEDERLMDRLGRFASLAYQSLRTIEDLRSEIFARDRGGQMRGFTAQTNRLATLRERSVSIAHEINQPIAAAVANADAALHWLEAEPPNLGRARLALGRILGNGRRASELIAGIGRLFED
jgi:hypothetical protein